MRIEVERRKCTGCHLCEMVCSLFHLGTVDPSKSAIRIFKEDLETDLHTPMVCRQCRRMKCLEEEEVDEAIEKSKFVWRSQRAEVCPFNGLTVFEDSAYHCDLCGGRPECVSVCTNGAIWIRTGKEENTELNEVGKRNV